MAEEEEEEMGVRHVMVVAYPLPGHIPSLLELAIRLARYSGSGGGAAFHVSFVTAEHIVAKLREQHSEEPRLQFVGLNDGLPPDHSREPSDMDTVASVETTLPHSFTRLLASILRIPIPPPPPPLWLPSAAAAAAAASASALASAAVPHDHDSSPSSLNYITCIISDCFLLWPHHIARQLSIPTIAFWPNSIAAFACTVASPFIANHCGVDPFSESTYADAEARNKPINGAAARKAIIPAIDDSAAPILVRDLPFYLPREPALWLRARMEVLLQEALRESLCVICNSALELEPYVQASGGSAAAELEESLGVKLLPVGPLLGKRAAAAAEGDPEGCMEWLERQKAASVLYISLGTVVEWTTEQAMAVAESLCMMMGDSSGDPPLAFLWVVAQRAVREAMVAEMAARGVAAERYRIVKWAAQVAVLAHESVGGFLTHCGWNSSVESVILGVPCIAWPCFMDQHTNAWTLANGLGVALRLRCRPPLLDADVMIPAAASVADICSAVSTLMFSPLGRRIRARSRALAGGATASATRFSSSAIFFRDFVQTLASLPVISCPPAHPHQ